MNTAVAFACAIVFMLAGAGAAIFGGVVGVADPAKQAAQVFELRDLVMGGFVLGAALVAWQGMRRDVE